jgi:multidrug efflux pump subunit AcrB
LLSSGAAGKTSSNFILAEFQKNAKDYKLPAGYSIIYGGANETNADSVKSILQAMALAALLIVSTLILQFNSFKSAFIVLATIPLALIGTFIGLTIFRIPLSFPGLIGVLALFGIVVKNAIILIDKINQNIKTGIHFEDAIIDAGKSRFEAIFITSFATILGIIPVTFSSEIWRALGFSIIFGLMLSSFLTLFVIPIIYSFLMKKEYDRKYGQTVSGEERC